MGEVVLDIHNDQGRRGREFDHDAVAEA
jgi:hypothetical protein